MRNAPTTKKKKSGRYIVPAEQILETPQTFAALIRVSSQAVRNWIGEGKIPLVIDAGRVKRFRREDALAALGRGGRP